MGDNGVIAPVRVVFYNVYYLLDEMVGGEV